MLTTTSNRHPYQLWWGRFWGFRHGKLKDESKPHGERATQYQADHYSHVTGMFKTQGSMELALARGSCAAEGAARAEDLLVVGRALDPLDRRQIASSTSALNKGAAKAANSALPHGELGNHNTAIRSADRKAARHGVHVELSKPAAELTMLRLRQLVTMLVVDGVYFHAGFRAQNVTHLDLACTVF